MKKPTLNKIARLDIFDNIPEAVILKLINEKTRRYLKKLKRLATKDPLTDIYNYRYFMEKFPVEVYRSKRYGYPLSLAIFDIDYFKSINDAYGHQAGDEALRKLTDFLKKSLRQSDILARYGGEEFVI